MWRLLAGLFVLCSVVCGTQPARAQPGCPDDPDKLGVARTVVIDAASGPGFGSRFGVRYSDRSILADGEVLLTFDDGPLHGHTKSILDTLASQCTKATFFMLGRMALADPAMVKEVARQGHTVASHTWSHANLQKQTPLEGQVEIEMGVSAVSHALGRPIAPFFRFPFLRDTEPTLAHLKERNLATFGIDVDSRDFETKDAVALSDRVIADLVAKRKGILLLHDIHSVTVAALPMILAELKQRGFKIVHVKAKAPAQTIPHYDELAGQEAERLRLSAPAHPLAKRALTGSSKTFSGADADPAAVKAASSVHRHPSPGVTQSPLPPGAQMP
jgi:peptidoglycan/xylan/chitin deacetylase (PgdA/CDA1 family)